MDIIEEKEGVAKKVLYEMKMVGGGLCSNSRGEIKVWQGIRLG